MSWEFNPLTSTVIASGSPTTLLRYQGQGNTEIRIVGTGFTFSGNDPINGFLNGGTVTSLEYWDTTGGGTKLQTLTLGTGIAGSAFFSFFDAAQTVETTMAAWSFALPEDDAASSFSPTQIVLVGVDGTKLVINGTGFLSGEGAIVGTISSIEHLDANDVPIAGHALNGLSIPLAAGAIGLGNGDASYHFFTGGNDTVTSDVADAEFPELDGGLGNDVLDGGLNANARVNFDQATSGVTVNLGAPNGTATGGAGTDTLINITHVFGSSFNDSITGNGNGNQLRGGFGNDVINGLGGADFIDGNEGDDTVNGGAGNDTLIGGNDTDLIDGGEGDDNMSGGAGADTFVYSRLGGTDSIADFGSTYFEVRLRGSNEVPSVTTTSQGFGNAVLNRGQSDLSLFLNVNGIDHSGTQTAGTADNLTGFHIHNGAAGVNGPVVLDISADPQTTFDGPADTATFNAETHWSGAEGLTGQLSNLLAGNLYVNLHTTGHSAGEIRGQIVTIGNSTSDRIDVSGLGISNMTDLSRILSANGLGSRLQSTYNGQVSTLEIFNVAFASLVASDFIFGGFGNETQTGTSNADDLFGGDGADTLNGSAGDDRLFGGAGADQMDGGAGDDTLYIDASDTAINGGADNDTVVLTSAMTLNLGFSNVENVQGSAGNDQVDGSTNTTGTLTMDGLGGNDILSGGASGDSLSGGEGDDGLFGNAGDDTMNGGNGIDFLNGGADNDLLNGGENNDALYGEGGNDTINGDAGNEYAFGGSGDDSMSGGTGRDYHVGDSNVIAETTITGLDTLIGGDDSDTLIGGYLSDDLSGENGNDALYGDFDDVNAAVNPGAADNLSGGAGTDFMFGGGGADNLVGGVDSDTLIGGSENDTMDGGEGSDSYYGQGGVDTFVFADNWGIDGVWDFQDGVEIFDLTAVTGLTSFAQLTITDQSVPGVNYADVAFGGNHIFVVGVAAAQLTALDFNL